MLDLIGKLLLGFALLVVGVGYGILAHNNHLFPMPLVDLARTGAIPLMQRLNDQLPWYYVRENPARRPITPAANVAGLTLVTGLVADSRLAATVVDERGQAVHRWDIDWFELWPDPSHVPAELQPKERPGELIHGAVVMANGDLVFNFERLGLIRLDACGAPIWRLPYRTHHAIHRDESGNFWIPGQITRTEPDARRPNYQPPFEDFTVLEVTPAGDIVREISVFDLLIDNGLHGLLHMANTRDFETKVSGDTLHLNDVETFPSDLPAGVFRRGDVMISLHNVNTIMVFDPDELRITYTSTGQVLRQHDPDFIDGNTISVFDNNNLLPDQRNQSSRIVTISALGGQAAIRFAGTDQQPFFTDIMGKHQVLANGNVLVTESRRGRAFEIDAQNTVVWEYINRVTDGVIGVISEAQRLAPHYDKAFFERAAADCPVPRGGRAG